jgi:uncharacterized phage-associated protein
VASFKNLRGSPVVPELYEKLQIYGSNKVTDKISISNVGEEELDDYSSEIINAVYDNYKKYNGIQLSNLTHQANTKLNPCAM